MILHQNIFDKAKRISNENLRACIKLDGIVAGAKHFVDVWARDALYASFGALRSGYEVSTKNTLKILAKYQKSNGQIPYIVRRGGLDLLRFIGIKTKFPWHFAEFRQRISREEVIDSGLLFIIVLEEYTRLSGDKKLFESLSNTVKQSLKWTEGKIIDGLLNGGDFTTWEDSVKKHGFTNYINVLYSAALTRAENLFRGYDNTYAKIVKQMKEAHQIRFEEVFYNGEYYNDWVEDEVHRGYDSYSHMLGIIFGVYPKERVQILLDFVDQHMIQKFTISTVFPKRKKRYSSFGHRMLGMGDYHNDSILWLQPGILYAIALAYSRNDEKAIEMKSRIAQKIVEDDQVNEVFELSGKPLDRVLYKSEGPFAWSAGLYLWLESIV